MFTLIVDCVETVESMDELEKLEDFNLSGEYVSIPSSADSSLLGA